MSQTYSYNLYPIPPSVTLVKRSDGVVIPNDPANANNAAYQAAVAAGAKTANPTPPTARMLDALAILATGLAITCTSAPALSCVMSPPDGPCRALSFRLRSGEISSQLMPSLRVRNTRLPPA